MTCNSTVLSGCGHVRTQQKNQKSTINNQPHSITTKILFLAKFLQNIQKLTAFHFSKKGGRDANTSHLPIQLFCQDMSISWHGNNKTKLKINIQLHKPWTRAYFSAKQLWHMLEITATSPLKKGAAMQTIHAFKLHFLAKIWPCQKKAKIISKIDNQQHSLITNIHFLAIFLWNIQKVTSFPSLK